jgi:D-tyrosyl-tRNA(Tyr) deacylase
MRIVVQRVKKAKVAVAEEVVAAIDVVYLLLVGFTESDNREIVKKIADKLINLRIFSDEADKLNLSIKEVQGAILSVSQFTLYADLTAGRRPSFIKSAKAEKAKVLFEYFNECLKNYSINVQSGIFQTDMQVSLQNDGPVTIILESEDFKW